MNLPIVSLDRAVYPQGAQVHATITDTWLNIDPTDEDSWTFGTVDTSGAGVSTHYQVFDENGNEAGNNASNLSVAAGSLTDTLDNLMCEENCVLELNPDVQGKGFVVDLQDNGDTAIVDDDVAVQDPDKLVYCNNQWT